MYSSRGIGRQTSNNDRRTNDRERHHSNQSPYQNSPDINYRSDSRDYEQNPHKGQQQSTNERREYRDTPSSPDNRYGDSSRGRYTPPGPPPKTIPLKNEPPPTPTYAPPPTPNAYAPQPTPNPYGPPPTPNSYGPPPTPNTYNQSSNSKGYGQSTPNNYGPPPTPNSYAPMPSNPKPSNPSQPNYGPNQSYDRNNQKYRNSAPNYTPTPIYKPTPVPNLQSQGYGSRDPHASGDPEDEISPEERIWKQKMDILFSGVNSIDDMITLKEQYAQKTQNLDAILQKSAIREGEILRNKRRDRSDHRDPMMLELKKMQSDIKGKLEEINKYRVEIDKRIRHYNKEMAATMEKVMDDPDVVIDKPQNYEAQLLQNTAITSTAEDDEEDEEFDEYEYENSTKEYYDPGSHWCRDCDKMVPKINEFFEHLHTKEHWSIASNDLKPWKKPKRQIPEQYARLEKTKTAVRGVQFLIPLKGFYCPLCKDYLADNSMAEEHMKGAKHNRIYNRFVCLNMDYEHKWNTDKGKALSRHQKRLKEEEQKNLEKKKKSEEQKLKEERVAKKRQREEESKKREKEREREKDREEREKDREDYRKNKSNHMSSSSDRFRLKEVTMDLKTNKTSFSHKDKDRGRERERDKQKKKTRIYSTSDSSNSPPRKKKTWFGDPYDDPKLKQKPVIKLMPLNKKTAQSYRCRELWDVIQEAKNKKRNPKIETKIEPKTETKTEPKVESKTEIIIASSPITMEIDDNEDINDNKEISNFVTGFLNNPDEDDHKDHKNDNNTNSDAKDEQNSEKDIKDSISDSKEKESESVSSVVKDKSDVKSDDNNCETNDKPPDDSLEGEPNLEIDTDLKIDDNSNKEEVTKDSDSNDRQSEKQIDSNDNSNDHILD